MIPILTKLLTVGGASCGVNMCRPPARYDAHMKVHSVASWALFLCGASDNLPPDLLSYHLNLPHSDHAPACSGVGGLGAGAQTQPNSEGPLSLPVARFVKNMTISRQTRHPASTTFCGERVPMACARRAPHSTNGGRADM